MMTRALMTAEELARDEQRVDFVFGIMTRRFAEEQRRQAIEDNAMFVDRLMSMKPVSEFTIPTQITLFGE